MSLILREDDLNPAAFVTVHSHKVPLASDSPFDAPPGHIHIHPGVPLKILSISRPFALCALVKPDSTLHGPISIDLRTVNLCALPPSYLHALTSFRSTDPLNLPPLDPPHEDPRPPSPPVPLPS